MSEQLAIIRRVGIGMRDCNSPVIWFDVGGEGWGALQVFPWDSPTSKELLSSVYDIKDLNGSPCMVERTEHQTVKFLRLVKVS